MNTLVLTRLEDEVGLHGDQPGIALVVDDQVEPDPLVGYDPEAHLSYSGRIGRRIGLRAFGRLALRVPVPPASCRS